MSCGPSLAQDAPTTLAPLVSVGYYEFPPYSYTDADGHPRGFVLDLTRRLLHEAGSRGEFRNLPGARLYAGLRQHAVLIMLCCAPAVGLPSWRGATNDSQQPHMA